MLFTILCKTWLKVFPQKVLNALRCIISGFDAYCGFMHIESTHTNPVAMVFISILQAESLTSLKKNSKKHSNINLQGMSMYSDL